MGVLGGADPAHTDKRKAGLARFRRQSAARGDPMSNPNLNEMWQVFDPFAGIFELRGIKNGQPTRTKLITWRDYPEDVDIGELMCNEVERTAMDWDRAGFNVYGVLNEIDENFIGSSARDKDITARRYILIDIDRAQKADCPATDSEVKHAIELSVEVARFMSAHGWLEPLVVMSGNGVHLYYYLNYQSNTSELTEKIRELLQLLGDKFDNAHVKVDRCVFNASRITKVIGTTAKKGIESPGRPYRVVKILSQPKQKALRVPCFKTVLDNTLRSLREGKPPATPKPTKLAQKSRNVQIDDTPNNRALVSRLLHTISPDCERHTWFPIVWSVLSTGITGAEELARTWSMRSERYTETDFSNLLRDYDPNVVGSGGQVSIGTLRYHAAQADLAERGAE